MFANEPLNVESVTRQPVLAKAILGKSVSVVTVVPGIYLKFTGDAFLATVATVVRL